MVWNDGNETGTQFDLFISKSILSFTMIAMHQLDDSYAKIETQKYIHTHQKQNKQRKKKHSSQIIVFKNHSRRTALNPRKLQQK